jgi:Ca2+-binding RTX toxin-like protein
MLARHHETVLWYESRYDPDSAGATKGMPGIDPVSGELSPAIKAALKAFGLSTGTRVEELLAASDGMMNVSGDGTSFDSSGNDDDLVAGSKGVNNLSGKAGSDILAGLQGPDILSGGAGADIFAFAAVRDSNLKSSDTITDFGSGGDRIALLAIADLEFLADEGAEFIGGAEIRWYHDGGNTAVEIDTNGDRNAEMRIVLEGSLTLDATDFLL